MSMDEVKNISEAFFKGFKNAKNNTKDNQYHKNTQEHYAYELGIYKGINEAIKDELSPEKIKYLYDIKEITNEWIDNYNKEYNNLSKTDKHESEGLCRLVDAYHILYKREFNL